MTARSIIDCLFELYLTAGERAYRGEAVSQLDHALHAAHLAEKAGASPALVVAALLHDYGHYVQDMDGRDILAGIHDHHDARGAEALETWFPAAVTEPIRMHIDAKRYLCATDPAYLASLSRGSRYSLGVQGGPLSNDEAEAFARRPHALDAARLRRWDDAAKTAGGVVPGLEYYRPLLEAVFCARADA